MTDIHHTVSEMAAIGAVSPMIDEQIRTSLPWPTKHELFGIGISVADYPAVTDVLFQAARRRVPAIVEHIAVHNVVLGVRDPAFRALLNDFDLVTMDGQGVRGALRLLNGITSHDRLTARELMQWICARAAREGLGIYLYGDEPVTVSRVRQRLLERFPGLRVVGCEPSLFRPLTDSENADLIARIHASGAAFVFVALGCPLQERFVHEHRHTIHAVQLCVGSAFKFIAGERVIAPRWVQRAGLEWLHRMLHEPRRLWRRYLYSNAAFVGLVGAELGHRFLRAMSRYPQRLVGRRVEFRERPVYHRMKESPRSNDMLKRNDIAPAFTAVDQDNKPVRLDQYRNRQNVILYFYPKDDTPGCTIEAKQFTDLAREFAQHDTAVLGVSKDSCDSHRAFIQKYGLNVALISDADGKVSESYGVWQPKEKDGVKKMGIVRSTFLINKQGVIEEALYGISPEGHAREMLGKVQRLSH